jgi:molybdopterin converting factor small subunit
MREVTVLLFGPARDAAKGCPSIIVNLHENKYCLSDLRIAILEQHGFLKDILPRSQIALQNKIIPRTKESQTNIPLENVEIVLVPPVSGG